MYLKGIWIPHLVSHKALLGPQLQQGGVGTNGKFPCLLAPPGGKLVPLWGEGGRASTARQEG